MTRILLALAGVALLAVVALTVLWLAGQLLVGVGSVAVSTAGVMLKLLWFLSLSALLGGLVYFVASAWRPAHGPARPAHVMSPTTTPAPPLSAGTRWHESARPTPASRVQDGAIPQEVNHD